MNSNCINLKEKGGNEAANQRVCRPAGVRARRRTEGFLSRLYTHCCSGSLKFRPLCLSESGRAFPEASLRPSVGRALGGRSKWSNGAGTPLQSIESARGRGRERQNQRARRDGALCCCEGLDGKDAFLEERTDGPKGTRYATRKKFSEVSDTERKRSVNRPRSA